MTAIRRIRPHRRASDPGFGPCSSGRPKYPSRPEEIRSPNKRADGKSPRGFAGSQNRRSPGLVVSIEEAMPKGGGEPAAQADRSRSVPTNSGHMRAGLQLSKLQPCLKTGGTCRAGPFGNSGNMRRPAPQPSDQTRPENPMNAIARIPAVISAMGMPLNALGTSSKSRRSRMPAKSTSASAKPRAVATE